jgi:predicted aldo/keto reductase-like oxidoreductase
MQYRQFGKLDIKVSALGFGAMRLPVVDGDSGVIDEPVAINMIRQAIDGGVNYVDTAYPYHRGTSEGLVAKALKDGYRKKIYIADKMPSWLVKNYQDLDRYFEEQCLRLEVEKIDFYLLHALNASHWKNFCELDVFSWIEKQKADGKIGAIGFSFHDEHSVFEDIIKGYDAWDFCQIQYNYMDVDYQAGERGLKLAAEKGMGVVVMEPLRGGSLAKDPMPPEVQKVFSQSNRNWKPVEWALQWVWNQPEVSLLLSGMSTIEQVQQNLVSADKSSVGMLTDDDLAVIDNARKAFHSLTPIPCTKCEYCLPCPSDVAIPTIFALYNEGIMYQNPGHARWAYKNNFKDENKADNCIECGLCEEACPQGIEIIDWLKTAHSYMTETD